MGLFSAIKSFFDPGIDEPWREEFKQHEAARKAQLKADKQRQGMTSLNEENNFESEDELNRKSLLHRESITFNPMTDTFDIYRDRPL